MDALRMEEMSSFNRKFAKPRGESRWRCGDIYGALSRI
jgi:hypothetical protein